jgi:hypothetical protein
MSVQMTTSGKPKRTVASIQVERRYANAIRLFLAGELPGFDHQRHVHIANILHNLPYGRELMHLGLQVMAYRHFVPDKYSAEITDRYWDQLYGTLPNPTVFDDLPGGAAGSPPAPDSCGR